MRLRIAASIAFLFRTCFFLIRKILVSVKFLSAILGPETAAPILWTPRISAFFPQENLHVHKIPCFFWGGGILGLGGGGSADFIFMGAGIFLSKGVLDTIAPLSRG